MKCIDKQTIKTWIRTFFYCENAFILYLIIIIHALNIMVSIILYRYAYMIIIILLNIIIVHGKRRRGRNNPEQWLPVLSNLQRCRVALHARSSDRFSLAEWRSIGANIYYNGLILLLCIMCIVYNSNVINNNNILIYCACALLSVPVTRDQTKKYNQWHACADAVFLGFT